MNQIELYVDLYRERKNPIVAPRIKIHSPSKNTKTHQLGPRHLVHRGGEFKLCLQRIIKELDYFSTPSEHDNHPIPHTVGYEGARKTPTGRPQHSRSDDEH